MKEEKKINYTGRLTNRMVQLSLKTTPEIYNDLKEMAHLENAKMIDIVERAVALYKRSKKYDF